jgi:hypothetical protein
MMKLALKWETGIRDFFWVKSWLPLLYGVVGQMLCVRNFIFN